MSEIFWEGHAPSTDRHLPPRPAPMRPRFWTPSIATFWLRHCTKQWEHTGM